MKGEPAPVVVAEPEQEAETSEADTGRKPLPETGTGATAEGISAPASQADVTAADDLRDGTPHSLINISSEAAPEPSVPVSEPAAEVSGSLPQEPDIPALQPTEETSFRKQKQKFRKLRRWQTSRYRCRSEKSMFRQMICRRWKKLRKTACWTTS